MKLPSRKHDVDRRIEEARDYRETLATLLHDVDAELCHLYHERETAAASVRAVATRRAALAHAVVRGEAPVIPDKDAAAVAELAAALPAALEARRRAEVEALTRLGQVKLDVHEYHDGPAVRRRGFVDSDEE